MQSNKQTLDATPEKRIFLSIMSEYDLRMSICELIDNAIDLWTKHKRVDLKVEIILDIRQQSITIQDNAGGIEESKLDHIVSPGKTSNDIHEDVIGYFGVGSKRAVIALAEQIAVHSRFEHSKTFKVAFDDYWISQDPSWKLPYSESEKQLPPYTTLIELNKLRIQLTEAGLSELIRHLGETYSRFINRGTSIVINGQLISAITFDEDWAYPPNCFPVKFEAQIPMESKPVEVEITSGLINHPGDPEKSYGVFMYCNGRLIARALTDFSVGFATGMIGYPHYNISLVRTIVNLKGQSMDMPWNSSKSGINTQHIVFQSIRQSIIDATKKFAQVSRSLQGKWESEIFIHSTGHVLEERLETIASIPKSYLPTPPASRLNWSQKIKQTNLSTVKNKPWADGLLESIVAVEILFKQSLSQKNRLCLIVLDSTIEIAYKEYLINEVSIGIAAFIKIAQNRTEVEKEVLKHLSISQENLSKIAYYYKLRCDLIHQRATPNITDEQVVDYRTIVEKILEDMFNLNFQ